MGRKFDYKTILLVGVLLVLLSACNPEQVQTPTQTVIVAPTETATITPTITNTPTLTWTPFPTRTNTPTFTPTPQPYPLSAEKPWILIKNDKNQGVIADLNGDGINYFSLPEVEYPFFSRDYKIAPDSKHLAIFLKDPPEKQGKSSNGEYNQQIWIMSIPEFEITEKIPLITLKNESTKEDMYLEQIDLSNAWSPDGRYFAFTALGEEETSKIYLYDTQVEQILPWVTSLKDVFFAEWSPDSLNFIFNQADPEKSIWYAELFHNVWVASINGTINYLYQPEQVGDSLLDWIDNETMFVSSLTFEPPSRNTRTINLKSKQIKEQRSTFCTFARASSKQALLYDRCQRDFPDYGVYLATFNKPSVFIEKSNGVAFEWIESADIFIASLQNLIGEADYEYRVLGIDLQGNILFKIEGARGYNVSPDGSYFFVWNSDYEIQLYTSTGEFIPASFANGGKYWSPDSQSILVLSDKQRNNQCLIYQYTLENDWAETSFTLPLPNCNSMEIIQPKQ